MLRLRLVLALTLALAGVPAFAQQGPDIDKVNGSITAEAGRSYGTLETVNGSIRIEADARTGDAETVNGSIRVAEQAHTGDLGTVNGSVRVAAQAVVRGSIETVNGSVFVDRDTRVGGSVETVNGAIGLVDADVGGSLETVNGDITVGIGSHVRGGLTVRKPQAQWIHIGRQRPPRIVIGPNARVDGPLVFERKVRVYVHQTAVIGPVSGATVVRYSGPRAPKD